MAKDVHNPTEDDLQRLFFRVVSGMHASISTHICWDYWTFKS